jgi:hypothetical protein
MVLTVALNAASYAHRLQIGTTRVRIGSLFMVNDHDERRIDLTRPDEIAYWAKKFDVSHAELRMGVQKAGPLARHVAALLGKNL